MRTQKKPAKNDAVRKKLEWSRSLLKNVDLLNIIINQSGDKIYFKDKKSRFILNSQTQIATFNIKDPAEIIGKTDFDFFSREHANQAFQDEMTIIRTRKPILGIIEKETWPDSHVSWAFTSKHPLIGKNGRIIGTWGISRDITDFKKIEEALAKTNHKLKLANEKLSTLSRTDPLSGLFNHRHFFDTIRNAYKMLGRSKKECPDKSVFSIIMFDIDRFKTVNDTFGHLSGDCVIKHVAGIITDSIRSTDTACRFGGDEFIILLPETAGDKARTLGEKLVQSIRKTPCIANEQTIGLTISAGVADSVEADDVKAIIRKADERLYLSKENGRDRVT
jgi:diguanylate cyclase (GGDEF)-like protein